MAVQKVDGSTEGLSPQRKRSATATVRENTKVNCRSELDGSMWSSAEFARAIPKSTFFVAGNCDAMKLKNQPSAQQVQSVLRARFER